jgi:hypothetical protein
LRIGRGKHTSLDSRNRGWDIIDDNETGFEAGVSTKEADEDTVEIFDSTLQLPETSRTMIG